jgi:hypothetical protein
MADSRHAFLRIQTLLDGAPGPTTTARNPAPTTAWNADDLQHLLSLMLSLVRPQGARYVYAFTPAAQDGAQIVIGPTPLDDGTGAALFVVTVTVDDDAATSDPVRLQIAAVHEVLSRSGAHMAHGSSTKQ